MLAYSVAENCVFRHFPKDHWRKIWSTNLLEWSNVTPRGALCTAIPQTLHQGCGHLPQPPPILRLVGAVLLEQHEHGQLEGCRMISAESMASIPDHRPGRPLQPSAAKATPDQQTSSRGRVT